MYCSQKLVKDFAKFCGLLRIYELYTIHAPLKPDLIINRTEIWVKNIQAAAYNGMRMVIMYRFATLELSKKVLKCILQNH